MLYKFIAWFLVFTIIVALILGSSWLFTNGYNKQLALELENVEHELNVAKDSIAIIEANRKEFIRIQELSITQPITPEHVRGEDLRAVIEGKYRCDIWLINNRRLVERLRKDKHDLQESRITFWD